MTRFSNAGASVWILARREEKLPSYYLFYGDAAIALAENNLDKSELLIPVLLVGGSQLPWKDISQVLQNGA